MTKAELALAVAERAGLSKAQAKDAVDAVFNAVLASLKAGDDVRVVGFGAFSPVRRPAGVARNPRTGATVQRPAAITCRFKPGDTLKAALNA